MSGTAPDATPTPADTEPIAADPVAADPTAADPIAAEVGRLRPSHAILSGSAERLTAAQTAEDWDDDDDADSALELASFLSLRPSRGGSSLARPRLPKAADLCMRRLPPTRQPPSRLASCASVKKMEEHTTHSGKDVRYPLLFLLSSLPSSLFPALRTCTDDHFVCRIRPAERRGMSCSYFAPSKGMADTETYWLQAENNRLGRRW